MPRLATGAAPAFAKLRGLTRLALFFGEEDPHGVLINVLGALVSLPGLAELKLSFKGEPAVVPAALGQLKGLRSLFMRGLDPCVLEAGCLDLPNLLSLEAEQCRFCPLVAPSDTADSWLPSLTALQRLTRIEFSDCTGPRFFDAQLAELPGLQRMMYGVDLGDDRITWNPPGACPACPWLYRPSAGMGALSSALRHLSFKGQRLAQFPLALTQLAALECLKADGNEFAEVPAGFTALSRLTELELGRVSPREGLVDLHVGRLDVRALGDLSAFPALCKLSIRCCEVMLCETVLGAVRHASLASLCFTFADPAPECALAVLQLGQALARLGRGSVLEFNTTVVQAFCMHALIDAKERTLFDEYEAAAEVFQAPYESFLAALRACGLHRPPKVLEIKA